MKRLALLFAGATLLIAADEPAPYQSSPERRTVEETRDWGPWAGPFRDKLVPSMMRDFGERYLYAPANEKLAPPAPGEQRVVFMGDSITDLWNLERFFPGKPYVNRGIGAQVTAQMLVRFEQDVVALKPRAVVILGGVNDVSGMLQVETAEGIVSNITAMADIAERHGIEVILCSILPVTNTPEAQWIEAERKPAQLRAINARLRQLAAARGYAFADYAPAMKTEMGLLKPTFTKDGIHPTAAGYAVMTRIVAAAISQALDNDNR
ncbi:GDSL-type esterase/lipase family protein [Novosphingobium sp. BW1]|uniref:GDSL-type esterase/lipase family protein n=1 Tax=Novosphingobium sp. BW1 TaxID=2592621 RepID=UPI0011DED6E6|nr:GDSL-type esterase/lipase family protein [Novosphingobium sp. BW1]TYC86274.1 GDSL family lipase [Novosphingobium sp. BW1]